MVSLSLGSFQFLNTHLPVSKDFLAQTGDPTATGTGGESIWSLIDSSNPRYFAPEILPKLKHTRKGTVSMAVAPALEGEKGGCGSQFFITLADNIDYLDGRHAVFGYVVEGVDTLDKLNEVFVDQDSRPFKDIRIKHVIILGWFMLPLNLRLSLKSLSRRSFS
jgi:peptidyl-prolyl cis-trans isomerase-like 4